MNQPQNGYPQNPQTQSTNRPLPEGIRLFDKHPNAPDFVLASLMITLDDLFNFVRNNPQYLSDYQGRKQLKLQILRSRNGGLYSAIDTYGTAAQHSNNAGWGGQVAQPQQQPQQPQQQPQQGWYIPPLQQGQPQPQPQQNNPPIQKSRPDDLPF